MNEWAQIDMTKVMDHHREFKTQAYYQVSVVNDLMEKIEVINWLKTKDKWAIEFLIHNVE